MIDETALSAILDVMEQAAREAGALAMAWFRPGARTSADVSHKDGGSPVTAADFAADRHLHGRLRALAPQAGWLSEETADTPERLSRSAVFVVDPIDGTRGFVAGDPRWAVSVALMIEGEPVLGVLHLPALAETYVARRGHGATLNARPIAASDRAALAGGRLAGPRGLLERIGAQGLAFEAVPKVPSLAYRFALVADGRLDAGFASTGAHDWDIAAADLVLRESGGRIVDAGGRGVVYNKPHPRHDVLLATPVQLGPEGLGILAQASASG